MIQPGYIYNIDGVNLLLTRIDLDIDGNAEYFFTAVQPQNFQTTIVDDINNANRQMVYGYNVASCFEDTDLADKVIIPHKRINPVETEKVTEKIDSNDWNALLGE